MDLFGYNITLSNIKSFIEGNTRYLIDKYGGDYINLPDHLKEQIVYRESVANKECIANKKCICNCSIPELFYASKQCELKCYPELMNISEWNDFKKGIKHLKDDFDKVIEYKNEDVNFTVKENSISKRKITLYNRSNSNLEINSIYTSCSCIKILDYVEIIPVNSNIDINFEFDSRNKKTNVNNLIFDIRLNNDINLTILLQINILNE